MNILITGANGFLGSYLVSFFNKKKYNVITIGRSGNSDIRCDLALEIPYLSIDFDLLIHCAGKAHSYPKNSNEENEFFLNNLDATKNLFFAIKNSNVKIKQFVFVSSVAGVIAFKRRKLTWPLTLQTYFCLVNVFGITRTLGWL